MLEKIIIFQIIYIVGMIALVLITIEAVKRENEYKKKYEEEKKDAEIASGFHEIARNMLHEHNLMFDYVEKCTECRITYIK